MEGEKLLTENPRKPSTKNVRPTSSARKCSHAQQAKPQTHQKQKRLPLVAFTQNILESKATYIAHQTNCVTIQSLGLAAQIFQKFPHANTYWKRKDKSMRQEPGSFEIRGNGNTQRYVVNLFGQYYPGRPCHYETAYQRLAWFSRALDLFVDFLKRKQKEGSCDFDMTQRNTTTTEQNMFPQNDHEYEIKAKETLEGTKESKKISICFPQNIGCGLAGSHWEEYLEVLEVCHFQNSSWLELQLAILPPRDTSANREGKSKIEKASRKRKTANEKRQECCFWKRKQPRHISQQPQLPDNDSVVVKTLARISKRNVEMREKQKNRILL